MVNFYVTKILNGELNPITGKVWEIENVPNLWQEKVKEQLKK